jgi:hypothetical protein
MESLPISKEITERVSHLGQCEIFFPGLIDGLKYSALTSQ